MEYVWNCFDDEGVTRKARNRKITTFIIYFALIILLTLVVAVYSYAAKSLTLEEAVNADVLRPASGFLPKVTPPDVEKDRQPTHGTWQQAEAGDCDTGFWLLLEKRVQQGRTPANRVECRE